MQKRYVVFFIFVFVLVSGIEGCDKGGDSSSSSQGLDFSFVANEPPDAVLSGGQDSFLITLLLTNNGEQFIPAHKIIATLSGIDSDSFSMQSLNAIYPQRLEGKFKRGEGEISGEVVDLTFDQANYKNPLTSDFNINMRVDLCYLYKTRGLANVCLKQEAVQRNSEDQCQIISDAVTYSNTEAPLQIKEVKQRTAGKNEVSLTFTIVNNGKGDVYPANTFSDQCVIVQDVRNWVDVSVRSSSGKLKISCPRLGDSNQGLVHLIQAQNTVTCTIKTENLQDIAFLEPVNIYLDYFYKDALQKPLTVQKSF